MKKYVYGILLFSLTLIFFGNMVLFSAETKRLIPVFKDDTFQFTGVAVSKDGRLFVSYPNWLENYKYAVVEVMPDGTKKPYPNEKWNTVEPEKPYKKRFVCVQALYIDDENYLWVVDPASPQLSGVLGKSNKVVKIDLKSDKIVRVYRFKEDVAGTNSYINDICVDNINSYAYLTDSANGAIIALNLKDGKSRVFLYKHYSTLSSPSYVFKINGNELKNQNGPVKIHSDGIALTPDKKYLYYKPLTDSNLYRIETHFLREGALTSGQLGSKVERLGSVCASDGMICDNKGNLYLSDIQNNSIVKYTPSGKKSTLIKSKILLWPDSFALSTDGFLYVTCSQIQNMPWFNGGKNLTKLPYHIFKIRLPE